MAPTGQVSHPCRECILPVSVGHWSPMSVTLHQNDRCRVDCRQRRHQSADTSSSHVLWFTQVERSPFSLCWTFSPDVAKRCCTKEMFNWVWKYRLWRDTKWADLSLGLSPLTWWFSKREMIDEIRWLPRIDCCFGASLLRFVGGVYHSTIISAFRRPLSWSVDLSLESSHTEYDSVDARQRCNRFVRYRLVHTFPRVAV